MNIKGSEQIRQVNRNTILRNIHPNASPITVCWSSWEFVHWTSDQGRGHNISRIGLTSNPQGLESRVGYNHGVYGEDVPK